MHFVFWIPKFVEFDIEIDPISKRIDSRHADTVNGSFFSLNQQSFVVNLLVLFSFSLFRQMCLVEKKLVHSSPLSLMFMSVVSEKCLQVCERNLPLNVLFNIRT